MKYKTILIFGPPGIGKSTQAKLLDQKRFFWISTGEILRTLEKRTEFKNSNLGKKVSKFMISGDLIPDKIILELLMNKLKNDIKSENFNIEKQILVLDGIPRNTAQIKSINKNFQIIKIIDLYCPNISILANRILKRAKFEKRIDDQNIKIIKKRLSNYLEETANVLKEYSPQIIVRINGIKTINQIQKQIKKDLSKFN